METRAHHVLIGLFTVIVVCAALLFGLWLAKSSADREYQDYDIIFNEAVTGLSQGASVQYNGIKVGDVTRLRLDPADPRRVLARVRLAGETPVKKDTHAKLALTGVTGTAIIQLSGGAPGSAPLVGHGDALPVIVADPSPLTKLLNNGGDLVTRVNDVLARASQLLSHANVQRIGDTLEHLDQVTGAVADQRQDIGQLVLQLTQISRTVNATLLQTQELARNTNALVNDQGRATLDSARASMASLERITANVDRLLNDNRAALDGGLRGLSDLGPAVHQLRETLESLQRVSRGLDENPAGYLLGRDKTKEFRP